MNKLNKSNAQTYIMALSALRTACAAAEVDSSRKKDRFAALKQKEILDMCIRMFVDCLGVELEPHDEEDIASWRVDVLPSE